MDVTSCWIRWITIKNPDFGDGTISSVCVSKIPDKVPWLFYSGVAQLIERQILALKVGSLNLSTATNKKGGPTR